MSAENVRDGKPRGVIPPFGFERVVGVEARRSPELPPTHDPEYALGEHVYRCFFCRPLEDHYCPTGHELIIANADAAYERHRQRQWNRRYAEEWDFEEGPF